MVGMPHGGSNRVPGAGGMHAFAGDLGGLHASSLISGPFGGGVANLPGNFAHGAWLPQGQGGMLPPQYLSGQMGGNFAGYHYMQGGGGNGGIHPNFLDMSGGAGMGKLLWRHCLRGKRTRLSALK